MRGVRSGRFCPRAYLLYMQQTRGAIHEGILSGILGLALKIPSRNDRLPDKADQHIEAALSDPGDAHLH